MLQLSCFSMFNFSRWSKWTKILNYVLNDSQFLKYFKAKVNSGHTWSTKFLLKNLFFFTQSKSPASVYRSFQGSISPTFYVQLLRTYVAHAAFCAYILGLYFTGVNLPAQKLRKKCWWNWAQCVTNSKYNVCFWVFFNSFCSPQGSLNLTWLI